MHLVMPADPVVGRVVRNDLCMKGKSASFVRHVEIDVSGTPLAGHFLAGQSFGVIPPGVDEHGRPHKVRLYSIACSSRGEDGAGRIVSTTPKRTIDEFKPQKPGDDAASHRLFLGVCSNYLCDCRPGDEVRLSGPSGKRFVLPVDPEKHDYVFLATGTGIAPFRGFVLDLFRGPGGPTRSQVHLFMGAPYGTDLLYDELFRGVAEAHRNFQYHTAISRERRADGRPGCYVHHLLDEMIQSQPRFRDLLAGPRTLVYVCGLAGMQFGLFQTLAGHRVDAGYLVIKDELAGSDPRGWTVEQMKRPIRPTRRLMLEVY
jgi:ferredoxin--NADP+ reductase